MQIILLPDQPAASTDHPNACIPLVKTFHPVRHGPFIALHLAIAVEETALERQARNLSVLIDGGANSEQAVRRPRAAVAWRVATADNDFVGRAIHNFKMIRQTCAGLVAGGGELLRSPQL